MRLAYAEWDETCGKPASEAQGGHHMTRYFSRSRVIPPGQKSRPPRARPPFFTSDRCRLVFGPPLCVTDAYGPDTPHHVRRFHANFSYQAGTWTKPASPIPVRQLPVSAGAVLQPRKFATIVSLTRETITSSNAEALVRAVLVDAVAAALDSALFSTTAGDANRPAGLLNECNSLLLLDAYVEALLSAA